MQHSNLSAKVYSWPLDSGRREANPFGCFRFPGLMLARGQVARPKS